MRILTQDISYRDQDVPLTGTLYEAERREAGNPGILLIHGGAGLDDHARDQARRYAAAGFTVFACDMLGDGVAGHRDRVVNAAAADWQLIMYGRAMHGFTHRTAAPGGIPGVEYDAAADERSFRAVRAFLAETLG